MSLVEGLLGERPPKLVDDEAVAAADERSADEPPAPKGRARLLRRWAIGLLAVLVLAVAYFDWVQPALLSRAQGQRLAALKVQLSEPRAPKHPPVGSAVALLEIPRLRFEQVVVLGTGQPQLAGGPGLLPGAALPGQAGLVEIAARRWTSGAPFAQLGELRPGDAIVLTDRLGKFRYVVDAPGDRGSHQSDLRLITAAEATGGTTAVRAKLAGEAAATRPPGARAQARASAARASLGRWLPRPALLLLVAGLAALVALAVAASWRAYRRQPPRLVWLLSTPVLVALGLGLLDALASLLPPLV